MSPTDRPTADRDTIAMREGEAGAVSRRLEATLSFSADAFDGAVESRDLADVRDEVTRILRDCGRRDGASDELLPLVYDQLRIIAQRRMRDERAGHTLQATALVHEAYVKLLGGGPAHWEDRGHFFRAAAEAMRRILIDHARRKRSEKRGGGRRSVPITVINLAADQDPDQILELNEALERLEAEDARAAEVVKLRFFAGLSVEETAETLGASERTVAREWAFARARLFQFLSDGADGAS